MISLKAVLLQETYISPALAMPKAYLWDNLLSLNYAQANKRIYAKSGLDGNVYAKSKAIA